MGKYKAKIVLWPKIRTVNGVTYIEHNDGLTFRQQGGVLSIISYACNRINQGKEEV